MAVATAIELRDLWPGDWPEVARIYAEGIATGNATFESDVPSWDSWDAVHLADPRLAAHQDGETVGWAALSPVSERRVYAGVAEVSVYVADKARRRGVGKGLLGSLVRRAEDAGVWTVQAGVFPENAASLELHKRCGFRVVGVRERIGQLNGIWRDVVLLERRSRRVQ